MCTYLQVFGPLFQQLEEPKTNIATLNLQDPETFPCPETSQAVVSHSSHCNGKSRRRLAGRRKRRVRRGIYGHKSLLSRASLPKEEFNLDSSNNIFSIYCKNCCKCKNSSSHVQSVSSTNSFKCCEVVHGGDWDYLLAASQYTGPNGVYFCPFCLVQLSDLKKGVSHAPITLPRYVSQDPRQ